MILQGSSLTESSLNDLLTDPASHTVIKPIPSLVRRKDGQLQYLIIGQKRWISLPASMIEQTTISHVQTFDDADPLVVVYLTLSSPTTEQESVLANLMFSYLDLAASSKGQAIISTKESCGCGGDSKHEDVSSLARGSCAGCTYCGPCEPGYCYRSCYCYGSQDWCCDRICGNGCSCW